MAEMPWGPYSISIHPFHAAMLAGSVPLFLGAALCDAAYATTYEIQWVNFSSWLIVGGLVFAGAALLFAGFDFRPANRRGRGFAAYPALLLAGWVVGLFNALMHARDAWGSMPAGLALSVIASVLVCIATWLGFRQSRSGAAR